MTSLGAHSSRPWGWELSPGSGCSTARLLPWAAAAPPGPLRELGEAEGMGVQALCPSALPRPQPCS